MTELDSQTFETAVENFANQAERWTRRIVQAGQAAPASSLPPPESTIPPTYA